MMSIASSGSAQDVDEGAVGSPNGMLESRPLRRVGSGWSRRRRGRDRQLTVTFSPSRWPAPAPAGWGGEKPPAERHFLAVSMASTRPGRLGWRETASGASLSRRLDGQHRPGRWVARNRQRSVTFSPARWPAPVPAGRGGEKPPAERHFLADFDGEHPAGRRVIFSPSRWPAPVPAGRVARNRQRSVTFSPSRWPAPVPAGLASNRQPSVTFSPTRSPGPAPLGRAGDNRQATSVAQ